jgi:hypothetical protein
VLFNSYPFVFLFLPAALAGFFALGRLGGRAVAAWLTVLSLIFYGYWDIRYLALLLGSILVNYAAGRASGNLLNALPLREAVAAAVADLPNVRLSDFQTEARLTDGLDHYKDLIHFDLPTTEYIIDALRDGRYRIRAADIAASNQRLIRHVNEYTICRDGELIGAAKDVRSGG